MWQDRPCPFVQLTAFSCPWEAEYFRRSTKHVCVALYLLTPCLHCFFGKECGSGPPTSVNQLPYLERERLSGCHHSTRSLWAWTVFWSHVRGTRVRSRCWWNLENRTPLIQVNPDSPKACNGQTAKQALGGMCMHSSWANLELSRRAAISPPTLLTPPQNGLPQRKYENVLFTLGKTKKEASELSDDVWWSHKACSREALSGCRSSEQGPSSANMSVSIKSLLIPMECGKLTWMHCGLRFQGLQTVIYEGNLAPFYAVLTRGNKASTINSLEEKLLILFVT